MNQKQHPTKSTKHHLRRDLSGIGCQQLGEFRGLCMCVVGEGRSCVLASYQCEFEMIDFTALAPSYFLSFFLASPCYCDTIKIDPIMAIVSDEGPRLHGLGPPMNQIFTMNIRATG